MNKHMLDYVILKEVPPHSDKMPRFYHPAGSGTIGMVAAKKVWGNWCIFEFCDGTRKFGIEVECP